MRALFFVFISLLFATNTWAVQASEKTYNKLNKWYVVDKAKCLELSKKMIRKNSKVAIPYYFASQIYYDKSKETGSLRGVYLHLNRSVRSAVNFEKYSSSTDRELVQWDEHIATLKQRSQKLITALNSNDLNDLATNLTRSLTKVESLAKHFLVVEHTPDILDATTKLVVPKMVNLHGLPNGNEYIMSANTSKEEQLLEYVNTERSKRNLYPLTWNEELSKVARYHAYDQATENYFSHSSKDYINGRHIVVGSAMDRIRRFYSGTPLGECIAAGNPSAYNTFEQWLNSSGHAEILLHPEALYIGVGFVYAEKSEHEFYWVLTTGR